MLRKILPISLVLLLVLALPAEGLSQQNDPEPRGPVLSHAYPNPFTTSTTFELTLQEAQNVRVEVFNVLGQRIEKLYDGELSAGVTHDFSFDATNLPPGLYLYRATGSNFSETRRVMRIP